MELYILAYTLFTAKPIKILEETYTQFNVHFTTTANFTDAPTNRLPTTFKY